MTPTWGEPGDPISDMKAALEKLKRWQPKEARLATLDVAPSVYRSIEALVQKGIDNPALVAGALLLHSDPTLPPHVVIGRDGRGRMIGVWFAGKGWTWTEELTSTLGVYRDAVCE
ncbi:MAG TPA: hypothetical protein VLI71_05770 [Gammaproteobacteria bacterium]|nr:hypothetical protein [Gammaproteobacteria bacterium]